MGKPYYELHADLEPFASSHSEAKLSDVEDFLALLNSGAKERDCQKFIEAHPALMAAYGRSGHGEWVIPQKRLGSEFVPDFVHGHAHSGGYQWSLFELECPSDMPFNRNGTFSTPLREAIDQIEHWRNWLESNLDYARRSRSQHGLALFDISPRSSAYIIIGRRTEFPAHYNRLREQLRFDKHIEVMSYDRFLEAPRRQAEFWDRDGGLAIVGSDGSIRFSFDPEDERL